jgi:hypothetical protein
MKRVVLLFFSITLFASAQFPLSAKGSNDRINLTAELLTLIEAPVWECDIPALQTILGKWIKVKDIQAIVILSDSVSCSIIHSDAIESSPTLKNKENRKDTIHSTVIRDNVRAHLEKLDDRSQKKELEEFILNITRNGNEIGTLTVFFSRE